MLATVASPPPVPFQTLMSASLSSSLDILSLTSSTRWASDSFSDEDEIVWSLSSSAVLSSSSPLNSPLSETADYVLVPRIDAGATAAPVVTATNPIAPPSADAIAEQMAALSLSAASQQRRTDVPTTTTTSAPPPPPAAAKKKGCQAGNKKATAPPSPPAASRQSQDGAPPTVAPPAAPRTAKRKKAKKVKAASTAAGGHGPSAGSTAAAAAPSNVAKKSGKEKKKKKLPGDGAAPAAAAAKKKKSAADAGAGAGARAPAPDHVPLSPAAADHVTVDGAGEQRSASPSSAMAGYHEAHKYMTSYVSLIVCSIQMT